MSLRDIVSGGEEITAPSGTFIVYALNLQDFGQLLGKYSTILDELFNGVIGFAKLVEESPDFCAEVIARGYRAKPDELAQEIIYAKQLGAMVQAEALEKIWTLTIPDEATLGKFISRIQTALLPKLQGIADKLLANLNGDNT